MQKSFIKSLVFAATAALAVLLSPTALAQLTSSGLTGKVTGIDGKAVSGASVTATHTPTNATFRAVSNEAGRFNFRGIPVGGPYTVTAKTDAGEGAATGIIAELGSDADVTITLKSEVLQLEKLVTTASATDLDASVSGAGYTLSSERLAAKPTSERSLADMISATPLVTLRSTFGDREESQITAVGQNNRFNSIMIDGSRTNDVFGLNGTGIAAFFNPLSLDTIEQLSVQLSPYDVRLSGFTGATINAVTKSGTNEFKGSAYYYFRGDQLMGVDMQGYNAREYVLTGAKVTPKLERRTYGATLGGPIIKNKLFFFLNYENYESVSAGRDPRFATPQEADILARLAKYATDSGKSIDWGNPVTAATSNTQTDKKILAKVDWNINADHRLSVRYSKTDGLVPQFGNFASATSSNAGVTGGGVATSSDGHFYEQTRVGESYAAALYSQWTPDFKTEIKYSSTKDDQLTPIHTVAPMTYVFGLTGTDLLNNSAVTNGAYIVGTEQFRQGNVINVDNQQMSALGDYFYKNFVITFGVEREQSNFNNLFRSGSYGLVAFRNYADFLNDTNVVIQRNYYDPAARPVSDISKFATNGFFAQTKWDINPSLNLNFGVRWEIAEAGIKPALNQPFLAATGFRNDGSLDGVQTFSPRVGFNYSLDPERKTQLRGGVGHFLGRSPWVFFSNSFGNTGVGTFTRASNDAVNPLPSSFTAYLRDYFDPANPIGTGTDNPSLRREVDFNDDGLELPSTWRGNLAVDRKLAFLDTTFTAEFVYSRIDSALRTTNENLKPTTVGADGRQRFAGNPSTAANAKYSQFTNIYRVSNTNVGSSGYLSLQWSRPVKNKWGFDVAYTRGRASEGQANGQTTAGGQFNRNVVFNQNAVESGTADFEVKDRFQVSVSRQFEFFKNYKTTTSLYYEGRSGNPYSYVFGGDINGDGVSFNDTVAVPTDANDARFDFSTMNSTMRDNFFATLNKSGLSKFAGSYAPKNAFREPWVNRLDLKFVQDIPVRGSAKLQLFFDFINFGAFLSPKVFGYTEISPFLSNDVFRTVTLTNATRYAADGRIQISAYSATYRNPSTGLTRTDAQYAPTPVSPGSGYTDFVSTTEFVPSGFNIDNGMSRWRIQIGAKILF